MFQKFLTIRSGCKPGNWPVSLTSSNKRLRPEKRDVRKQG